MKVIHFTLKNNLVLNLLTVLVLGMGVLHTLTIQREAFPHVNFDIVTVATYYPGASPREVEQYVTQIIEEEIDAVEGIKQYSSVSLEGFSLLTIQLDPDRREQDKDRTITDIQRAVDRARDLPDDLPNPPLVETIESTNFAVLDIALHGEASYNDLYRYTEQLQKNLEALPDVSKVEWRAKREQEFWVEIDPDRLRRLDLGLADVIGALRTRNINLPGGAIKAPDGEVLVRTIGETADEAALEDVVLRTNASGYVVRLRDVAQVRRTFEESNRDNRAESEPAAMLSVIIDANRGDIIRMVEEAKIVVDAFLAEIEDPRIGVAYVNDMSFFVKTRLGVLVNNGLVGILLVLGILLLFLSNGIATVTAIGLPVAFLGTILIMSLTGFSINLLTMFALIIVLGIVVDDAIIVGENIWQHYENGASPMDAAYYGTAEVFWPVTATILTTIAAFSPMLFVTGIFGKFMYSMPVVVIIALAASWLEAMFVLPSHAYDMLRYTEWRERRKGRAMNLRRTDGTAVNSSDFIPKGKLLAPVLNLYGWVLGKVLTLRYLFIAGVIALLAFSLHFAQNRMNTVLFPAESIELFFIRATMPPGTPIEDTIAAIKPIEALIATLPDNELMNQITNVGIQQNDPNFDPFTRRGSHVAQVLVFLTPEAERNRTANRIIESLREDVQRISEEQGYVEWHFDRMNPGPPVGKPVAIRVTGHDLGELRGMAGEIASELRGIPHVSDVSIDFTDGKDEIRVVVDDIRARNALLTVDAISRHILASFEGQIATHVRAEGERIPVRVRFHEQARNELDTLYRLKIPNQAGMLIPLSEVAHFERTPGLLQIARRDGTRIVTVTANLDERETSSLRVNQEMMPFLDALGARHPEVRITAGGEFEDTQESLESLGQAFVFAMGLIFLILAAQFGSLTQPFVVMSAIPFGIIGVIWAFFFTGLPMSFLGFVGMIGLTGVVVNDSIVLVSFLNNARVQGMSVREACIHAGKRRFRAVWLTTLTTVFGLTPMIYGIGGMDKFLQPAAVALGYGLIFGTVLVLLFVPAVYMIRTDIGNGLGWLFRLNGKRARTG